jgi:hypothetical protein
MDDDACCGMYSDDLETFELNQLAADRAAAEADENDVAEALTERERQAVWNALRVAAERYDEDARTMAAEAGFTDGARIQLVSQFERQAAEARELLERFE